ncbi:hypothetical protein LCM20_09730 [Halobacillus litoralis]|uniref:hypothetical protein n=1 Tax=Halobacillus litoralis TaxID=45668 RepID=UPI001CD416FB|nr:hypothetical protein [Halobacillus litoralis]MCA0970869.1 hypothetical protein [Halobacillus litoralis]
MNNVLSNQQPYKKWALLAVVLFLIAITLTLTSYIQDKRLERAVHEEITERKETDSFTVLFIESLGKTEAGQRITVAYTVEGKDTKFWGWYDWKNGELKHDFTREVE